MKDSKSSEDVKMREATSRRSRIMRVLFYVVLPLGLLGLAFLFLNWGLRTVLNPAEGFSTYQLPYMQDFEDATIKRWFTRHGEWIIRDGTLVQVEEAIDDAELFVPHWLKVGQPYRYSMQMTLSETAQAAGLIFNAQYPEIYSAHHKVLVSRQGDQFDLFSGPVDREEGFQPEASVSIPEDIEAFKLEVVVGEDTYDVRLNGLTVLESRPLAYKDGILGMVTEGGPVAFDNMILSDAEDIAYGVELVDIKEGLSESTHFVVGDLAYTSNFAGVSGASGWTPFKGDWQIVDGMLTQNDPTEYDAGIGYEGDVFEWHAVQATLSHREGTGGGVLFNMPSPYQHIGAHMVRYSDTAEAVIWGHFDNSGRFNGQGFANVEAPGDANHTFKILSGDQTYAIYLDNELIAQDIPLIREDGYVGLVTSRSAVAYHLVEIFELLSDLTVREGEDVIVAEATPTPPPVETREVALNTRQVATDEATPSTPRVEPVEATPQAPEAAVARVERIAGGAPVYGVDLAASALYEGWIPISGDWRITDLSLTQLDPRVFDAATGYEGSTFESYVLQVSLAHQEGAGGGVLFNMPAPDQLNGAHMVRYSDTADAIFWGAYDDIGNFVGQGYAKVDAPGTSMHTMRVVSYEASYAIYLDDRLIASEIPLSRNQGHIGLLTTRSAAAFGPVEVFSLAGGTQQRASGTGVAKLLEKAQGVSGDWTVDGTVIVQENTAPTDFVLSSGVFAAAYNLATTITLPDDPELQDAGAGIIFHMPEPNVKKNAHMVRLADAGAGAFWGRFDENEVFVGEGWTAFSEGGSRTLDLLVKVKSDSYDLLINGNAIASEVPLQRRDGWIGLLAFRGPIVFEDIQLTLGGLE